MVCTRKVPSKIIRADFEKAFLARFEDLKPFKSKVTTMSKVYKRSL